LIFLAAVPGAALPCPMARTPVPGVVKLSVLHVARRWATTRPSARFAGRNSGWVVRAAGRPSHRRMWFARVAARLLPNC